MKLSAVYVTEFKAAGCFGKYRFPSYNSAKKAAVHIENANIYRCEHCSKYHIAHGRKLKRKPKIPQIKDDDMLDYEGRN